MLHPGAHAGPEPGAVEERLLDHPLNMIQTFVLQELVTGLPLRSCIIHASPVGLVCQQWIQSTIAGCLRWLKQAPKIWQLEQKS